MIFKVVEANDLSDLEDLINKSLKNGWILSGSISCVKYFWRNDRKGFTEYESWYGHGMIKH